LSLPEEEGEEGEEVHLMSLTPVGGGGSGCGGGRKQPRCKSQPSALLSRKCGVKRRREDDRPMLNFNKMIEVRLSIQDIISS